MAKLLAWLDVVIVVPILPVIGGTESTSVRFAGAAVLFFVHLVTSVAVWRAEERRDETPLLWAMTVFFLGIVGIWIWMRHDDRVSTS